MTTAARPDHTHAEPATTRQPARLTVAKSCTCGAGQDQTTMFGEAIALHGPDDDPGPIPVRFR